MSDGQGLQADELTVAFGGLAAVSRLSLDAPRGRLTGLIGPNGAGKTTTFNALCGLVPLQAGSVSLFGSDVSNAPPQLRARLGLGRTFQRMELFNSLTVADNVVLGREAALAGPNVLKHLVRTRAERLDVAERAEKAMSICGIGELRTHRVGLLSTGQRRLVELARAVAGDFAILLMDEPSSGLDPAETLRFGGILRDLVDAGTGILLVEHDMSLVMDVCEHVYVVDFGELIFEGSAREAAVSDVVRAAYLGDDFEFTA